MKAPRYPFQIISEDFFSGDIDDQFKLFVFQKQKYLAIYDLKILRVLSHSAHWIAYAIIFIFWQMWNDVLGFKHGPTGSFAWSLSPLLKKVPFQPRLGLVVERSPAWDYAILLYILYRDAGPKRCYHSQTSRAQSPLNQFYTWCNMLLTGLHHSPVVSITFKFLHTPSPLLTCTRVRGSHITKSSYKSYLKHQ